MIAADRLTKQYGKYIAVRNVSFHIPRGQVVAFLGPNGAGKTTTIRVITGYHPPTAGRVLVAGYDVTTHSREARKLIGYLPESTPLHTEMRVTEYLDYHGRLYDIRGAELRKARDRVIDRCWLKEVKGRLIGQLSKGYRQRVGLAAALLHDPPVLILDEPTAGLDPAQIRETRKLMRELAGDHTMLLSTHILPEAQRVCDRVIIIARGTVRADGTPAELLDKFSGSDKIIIECLDPATVLEDLRKLGKIEQTKLQDSWTRLTVQPAHSNDIREKVFQILRNRNIQLRELKRNTGSLEQVFIRLTSDDELPADSPHTDNTPVEVMS